MIDSLYFDSHTATRPFPEVLEKYIRFSREYWADPTSYHFLGQQQLYPLQKSLDSLFEQLGVLDSDELFFFSGKEEAIYELFLSVYFQVAKESGKTLFLYPEGEESSITLAAKQMQRLGCSVKAIPLNDKGQITKETLESVITPRTALVSLSWANALTGVLHPIFAIADLCKEKDVQLHIDASYVLGKRFFRFQDLDAAFLTLDGSLIHGPLGTSLLAVKKEAAHLKSSWASRRVRTPDIGALSEAVEMLSAKFEHYSMEVARLRDRFEEGILRRCLGARALFKEADRLPNVTAIAFPPVSAESLLFLLNAKGLYASLGKDRRFEKNSIEKTLARSLISFSFSFDMTEQDIDRAIDIIEECFLQLKACSGEIDHA
jgi:cysteine desulfurase